MIRRVFFDRVLNKKIFGIRGKVSSNFLDTNFLLAKKLGSYNKKLKDFYLQKNSIMTKNLVGQRIFVHNGKEILSLKVTPSMLGFKVGEFFFIKKVNKVKSK